MVVRMQAVGPQNAGSQFLKMLQNLKCSAKLALCPRIYGRVGISLGGNERSHSFLTVSKYNVLLLDQISNIVF